MRRALGTLVLVASVALMVAPASAEETTSTVTASEPARFVLADGSEIWAPAGMKLPQLNQGTTVRVTYKEKDGRKVITEFELVGD